MKKLCSLLLILCLIFSLSACGDNESTMDNDTGGYCTECGEEISATDKFCSSCGAPINKTNNTDITDTDTTQDSNDNSDNSDAPSSTTSTPTNTKPETSKPSTSTHTHSFSGATCTAPEKCSCGATSGSALGHSYSSADCTNPQKCSRCGTTSGSALGHSYRNGNCSRCGNTDPNYFEPIVYSGKGDKVIQNVNLPNRLYKITLEHNGARNFIVVPYDGDGDRKTSWSNEIGAYFGDIIFSDSLTNGFLEIKADGNWAITISSISDTGTTNLSGTGDCVSPFFSLPKGALTVNLNYVGTSNFIVIVYDNEGNRYSSLANEIGSYNGIVIFNKGDPSKLYCIEVTATGTWSVDFGLGDHETKVKAG